MKVTNKTSLSELRKAAALDPVAAAHRIAELERELDELRNRDYEDALKDVDVSVRAVEREVHKVRIILGEAVRAIQRERPAEKVQAHLKGAEARLDNIVPFLQKPRLTHLRMKAAESERSRKGQQATLETKLKAAESLLRELYEYVCKLEGAYGGQAAVRSYMKKPDELHPGIADVGKRVRTALGIEEST